MTPISIVADILYNLCTNIDGILPWIYAFSSENI